MLKLGLTGSIGAGKSTVANLFKARGIPVLEADVIARAVSSWPEVLIDIGNTFGSEFVNDTGMLRAKIAALVFNDATARSKLNAIIHPRVRSETNRLQNELAASGAMVVVQDIPLLFENNYQDIFDATILVDAPLEIRIARVMTRDGLAREQVLARDMAQMPASEKRRRATFVLENDGDTKNLAKQFEKMLEQLGLASV